MQEAGATQDLELVPHGVVVTEPGETEVAAGHAVAVRGKSESHTLQNVVSADTIETELVQRNPNWCSGILKPMRPYHQTTIVCIRV